MPADEDPLPLEETPKTPNEDWVKYLNRDAINEMIKEATEEEKKVEDYMGQIMSDRLESFVCVSPPHTPRKSIYPFIESVMESVIIDLTSGVISTLVNEMNNSSAYSSMSNDHEYIDP